MTKTSKAKNSIKLRVIAFFCSFAVFIAIIFSLFSALFVYMVEDTFFENSLKAEAAALIQEYKVKGKVTPLNSDFISLVDKAELPVEIQEILQEEPQRKEFGVADGKHYHLLPITLDTPKYLLAEVSKQLVVRPFRDDLYTFLLVITLIMLVLALLVGYFLAQKTIAPLSRLTKLIDSSQPQDFPNNFSKNFNNDEIGFLAKTLESSWQKTQQLIEREQHFTRDVSHELRTPLAIIKTSNELQAQNKNTNIDSTLCQKIDDATEQASAIINALLALAREESQSEPKTNIKLLPLVEQAIIEHSHLLGADKVKLQIQVQPQQEIFASKLSVVLLLNNLISNAFQYTREGTIKISLEDQLLTISDQGIGIDEEIAQNALEPLVKGKHSKGFGIGLSIVNRLCELHGYRFDIKSTAQGTMASLKFN